MGRDELILAILQARVSSTRLPGKVLKPILSTPMLFLQIERLMRCRLIDELVVATSRDASDDALAEACTLRGVAVSRGSLDDVLQRFVNAALPLKPTAVVRLTGDCPLADWKVIDSVIGAFSAGGCQYASNIDPPTFPDGLDVEVIGFEALLAAAAEAQLPYDREHVTPFIRRRPERFPSTNIRSPVDRSEMRWTVDEPADFAFVSAVYEALYPVKKAFDSADILSLLRVRPELERVNEHFVRNTALEPLTRHRN
jgi:spore coat polysaccharide biosynthesis protein SpsF (cytidylyltransferase family)